MKRLLHFPREMGRMSRLARVGGLGAQPPGLPIPCVSPSQHPQLHPGRSLPLSPAPSHWVSNSLSSEMFLPELAGPIEAAGTSRWIWWPLKSLEAISPHLSESPLLLPHSVSLLFALPASLFCPSCLNRLKPTWCSGFLRSW